MQVSVSVSRRVSTPISRTLFFGLSTVALIALISPTVSFYLRGLLGFFLLTGLALLLALVENSFNRSMRRIRQGISDNKWLVLFAVWYFLGLVLNLFVRGRGLDDWRLIAGASVFFIGMGYAFAFMRDETCYRYFQIGFLVVLGLQSVFTARELSSEVGIARVMLAPTGGWEFGNQNTFVTLAMALPMLLWRSLSERGFLRVILMTCSVVIGLAMAISSFATPLGLVLVGGGVVAVLLILRPIAGVNRGMAALIAITIIVVGMLAYQFTRDIPLLESFYYRLENFISDPRSGGYAGIEVQGSRWYLAEISLNSFFAEPLLGKGGGSTRHSEFVGGHSSFFDTLGAYGLLGGGGALAGLISVMGITAFKRFWQRRDWETLLALASVVMLTVAGIVNPYWEGFEPMFVLIIARPFSFRNDKRWSHR